VNQAAIVIVPPGPTQNLCDVLHPILALLDGPRGENRTLIYDHLSAYRGSSAIVRAITDLTEDVTNGDISWPEYGNRCRDIIAHHNCGGSHAARHLS
jgi:hypothetical protein